MGKLSIHERKLAEFDKWESIGLHSRLPIRVIDRLDSDVRKAIIPHVQLDNIADRRGSMAVRAGWKFLERDQIQKLYDGMIIRCFATSCGCSGQITKIIRKENSFFHSGHDEAIAWRDDIDGWDFTTGVKGRIMVKKGEFDE